jgi:hypothetical protein
VVARRRLAPEHHSRLVKAWELVADRAVTINGDGSATVHGKDQPEYRSRPVGLQLRGLHQRQGAAPFIASPA